MSGPLDPSLIVSVDRLPAAMDWKHLARRLWDRCRGRICQQDFDLTFDAVLKWLEGRTIDLDQARWSANDIFSVMAGVSPVVFLQRCEITKVVMITVTIPSADGKAKLTRTRSVKITDPATLPEAAAVPPRKLKRA